MTKTIVTMVLGLGLFACGVESQPEEEISEVEQAAKSNRGKCAINTATNTLTGACINTDPHSLLCGYIGQSVNCSSGLPAVQVGSACNFVSYPYANISCTVQ
jgi:hypothetical protein